MLKGRAVASTDPFFRTPRRCHTKCLIFYVHLEVRQHKRQNAPTCTNPDWPRCWWNEWQARGWQMRDSSDVVDSWKEIASFLRRGVRTVQRWEKSEGLPVHRHHHLKRGSVYALQSEIAVWLQARQAGGGSRWGKQTMDQFDRLRKLTMRQAVLTSELQQLLVYNAAVRTQLKRPVSTQFSGAAALGRTPIA
jgi:hypothetical protein